MALMDCEIPGGVVDAGGGDLTMPVLDVLDQILVVTNPDCTILDHILVATGLDTSQTLDHPPIVGAHRCRRCALQLESSLRCGLVAHICNICLFLLNFLFLSC